MKLKKFTILVALTAIYGNSIAGFDEAYKYLTLNQYELSEREFLKCAESGDSDCQYHLGFLYYGASKIKWITTDKVRGIYWYKKASDNNHPYAQYEYGNILRLHGQPDEGLQLIKLAAQNKMKIVPQAADLLGLLSHANGDYSTALKWFEVGVNNGYSQSMANIASMYIEGQGTPKNYPKAFNLLTKAASQNDPLAYYNLAQMYISGLFVERDLQKAIDLLEKILALGVQNISGRDVLQLKNAIQEKLQQTK